MMDWWNISVNLRALIFINHKKISTKFNDSDYNWRILFYEELDELKSYYPKIRDDY